MFGRNKRHKSLDEWTERLVAREEAIDVREKTLDVREEAVADRERKAEYRDMHPLVPKEITLVHRRLLTEVPGVIEVQVKEEDGRTVQFSKRAYMPYNRETIWLSDVTQYIKNLGDRFTDMALVINYQEPRR